MNKKMLYEQPQVDIFTVQTEGVICQSVTGNQIPDWQDGSSFPGVF